ncbi:hypothetical protein Tco_0628838 [Tanacetum coccineum]|uniref:Uncharacterized protein n=1 Tax=Tanacetum coccineum TaxID=301880 RepID=A0ABQ4WRI4_9ASTR
MMDLVNQRKKFFAEERAKAKRNKPITQSQLKTYMMNYLKNQGSWKLNQLRKLSFEEVKEEFDKLVKQIDSFAPISFEATKDSLKRFGEELQTKTSKRLKEDKDDEAKDDEPTKKLTKRRKQIARKGMHTSVDENVSDDSDKVDEQEETNTGTETPLNPVPVAMKTPNAIWSEIGTKKIVSWRYYDTSRVHCLNLESMDVYLLSDRKYPLPAEVCKKMLKMKLLDGKMNEDCYRLLKMMEKQAGIRVHTIMTSTGLVFHMLVESKYPLTKEVLSQMLELKLETEEESSMALELIKFVRQQLEEFEDSNDDDTVTSTHEDEERV